MDEIERLAFEKLAEMRALEILKEANVITQVAKPILRPTLGKNVKTLAGVTKVKLPGVGWTQVPAHMAGR